ncbi:MAG: hypothetical protein N3A38_14635, partial [Planctomycetota bacterium]|nr:hypothetical protein [Planctomycetota bacterium]
MLRGLLRLIAERSGMSATAIAILLAASAAAVPASCRGAWGEDAVQPAPGGEKPAAEPVFREGGRRRSIADILPGDAVFAAAFGRWSDVAGSFSATPPARIWAEPEIRAFVGEPLVRFGELIEQMAPSERLPIAELRAMFPGPVAVAMGPGGREG